VHRARTLLAKISVHAQAVVKQAFWQTFDDIDAPAGQAAVDQATRRWAHMLGYRGHWSTRSRRYSTTFTALRAHRQTHARTRTHQALGHHDDHEDQAVIVVASWTYAGRGHRTEAERWLALAAAARALEHRRLAREELSSSSRAA
jgi:hypothetical protein